MRKAIILPVAVLSILAVSATAGLADSLGIVISSTGSALAYSTGFPGIARPVPVRHEHGRKAGHHHYGHKKHGREARREHRPGDRHNRFQARPHGGQDRRHAQNHRQNFKQDHNKRHNARQHDNARQHNGRR